MKHAAKNELTVIIPFLNEGEEVFNTLKSLRENSKSDFDIILINDNSTDEYDYEQVAIEFGARYIKHEKRKGVAVSRDEGIDLCTSEYFLLLDAHMRVYQKDWVEIILAELKKSEKTLFCCKTMRIEKEGELDTESGIGYGTYFDFSQPHLPIPWITKDLYPEEKYSHDIPCILGASYACSKSYWKYLNGLTGLKFYGFDEQLISMKVWLEGGTCKLIKQVTFGHIFRTFDEVPYEYKFPDFVYNNIFLNELFFKDIHQNIEKLKGIKKANPDFFNTAVEMISENVDAVLKAKKYHNIISKKDLNLLIEFNDEVKTKFKSELEK